MCEATFAGLAVLFQVPGMLLSIPYIFCLSAQPALGDLASAGGLGLDDPQRSLPTPTILCDSVT